MFRLKIKTQLDILYFSLVLLVAQERNFSGLFFLELVTAAFPLLYLHFWGKNFGKFSLSYRTQKFFMKVTVQITIALGYIIVLSDISSCVKKSSDHCCL